MRQTLSVALIKAVCFLAASSAFAQHTTGGIAGIVADESGAVLPGTAVTVSGEGVMGSPEVVTDEEGRYRFLSLAPGLYELTARLTGFGTARRTEVRVQLGSMTEENITLALAALTETVVVEASRAVVDTQSSKIDTNYDRTWIESAPLNRKSFFDVLASAPGVDPSFFQRFPAPGSFGSFGDQNLYQLDGTDLTDSFNFESSTLVQPSVDIIEEVQILSLGAPAEYGSVQGAVFNIVTRQGSNAFHGGTSFYFQNDDLTGRNTTAEQECVGQSADCIASGGLRFRRLEYKDFSTQLGGPIKKDRLWFFTAYDHIQDSFVDVGVAPGSADRTKTDHGFGKVNFQLSPKHSFVPSLTFEHRVLDAGLSPNAAPSTQNSRDRKVYTPTFTYTGTLSNSTVLDVRYAGFYSVNKGGATPGAKRVVGKVFIDFDTGKKTGDPFGYYEYHLSRTAVNSKLSHHASDFLGASHDFKFGVQYNNSPVTGESSYSDYIFTYTYAGTLYNSAYIYNPFTYAATARTVGAYVDDAISIGNRLTMNLGLRYDRTRSRGDETPRLDPVTSQPDGFIYPEVDFFSWNTVAPRVGFNLKLTADGRTVLKSHYGRYYPGGSTGALVNARSHSPVFAGTYNFVTGAYENVHLNRDSSNTSWDPTTKASKTDQYIVSVERELFGLLNVSATYLHKRTRRLLGWLDEGGTYETRTYVDDVGPEATGNSFDVLQLVSPLDSRRFVLQAPPGTRSDYNAVTLGATKRMSSEWQLTMSATIGKATKDRTNGTTSTQNFQGFGQDPNNYVNSSGLSPRDRLFVFKTQALYAGLPWGVSVSANYVRAGGYPRRRTVFVGQIGRNVTAAPLSNDKRFPSSDVLDLRLQKEVNLRDRARINVFANVFNLFNDDAFQGVQSDTGTSELFGKPKDFILPRRFMLGAKVDF